MDVSIIIVNYNTCDLLKQCIQSIITNTREVVYEIIVIDNDSHDESCQMLKNDFPTVKLIRSNINLGFGKANNLGIKQASGKYLFFLNSDTILCNNAIKNFFEFSISYTDKLGATGTILKDNNGNNIHSYGKFITIKSELKNVLTKYSKIFGVKNNTDYLYPPAIKESKEVDYITGADLFIPYKVYQELEGFDPMFFMYCEEVDWQYRMAINGYKRLIINEPEIIHLEGGSDPSQSSAWSFNRMKNIFTSKLYYIKKHNKYSAYICFRFFYLGLWIPLILLRKELFSNKLKLIQLLFTKNI